MPHDPHLPPDSLELLRCYRALPRPARQALLRCARLLHEDPPELRLADASIREHLITGFRLYWEYWQRVRRRGG